ncbi:hypothetical protein TNCV_2726361 [Trichonephila clavipes]|nr:hypothetical protein TNCV_2726361 [Trichonephila clavipes]
MVDKTLLAYPKRLRKVHSIKIYDPLKLITLFMNQPVFAHRTVGENNGTFRMRVTSDKVNRKVRDANVIRTGERVKITHRCAYGFTDVFQFRQCLLEQWVIFVVAVVIV